MVHHPCTWQAVNITRYLGKHLILYFTLYLKFLCCSLLPFTPPLLKLCLPVYRSQNKWNYPMRDWIGRYNITVKQTGDSSIVSSRKSPRVFLQIGLKFTPGREDFLVVIYSLLSLVLLGPCRRREKWETNVIIYHL